MRPTIALTLLTMFIAAPLAAQSVSPEPGAHVRVEVEGLGHAFDGHLVALTADSVILRIGRSRNVRATRAQVVRMEVARRVPSARHTLEGMAIGGGIGATLGVLVGPTMIATKPGDRGLSFSRHDGRVIAGLFFGVVGTALGGVLGHARATQWQPVPLTVGARGRGIEVAVAF